MKKIEAMELINSFLSQNGESFQVEDFKKIKLGVMKNPATHKVEAFGYYVVFLDKDSNSSKLAFLDLLESRVNIHEVSQKNFVPVEDLPVKKVKGMVAPLHHFGKQWFLCKNGEAELVSLRIGSRKQAYELIARYLHRDGLDNNIEVDEKGHYKMYFGKVEGIGCPCFYCFYEDLRNPKKKFGKSPQYILIVKVFARRDNVLKSAYPETKVTPYDENHRFDMGDGHTYCYRAGKVICVE